MPVDRKGNTLSDDELQKLSVLLKMPVADLKKKIEDNKRAFGAIYLANDVGVDVATQIEEKKDDFPGIQIEVNPLRVYPLGAAGAQVLGYVGEGVICRGRISHQRRKAGRFHIRDPCPAYAGTVQPHQEARRQTQGREKGAG